LTSKTCSNILKLNSDIGLLHLIELKINPAVLNYLSQSVEEGHKSTIILPNGNINKNKLMMYVAYEQEWIY
jgi:hypothetical protein